MNKKYATIITAVSIVLLSTLVFILAKNAVFRVVSTSPKNGSNAASSTQKIEIKFSKQLKNYGGKIKYNIESSSPDVVGDYSQTGSSVVINLSNLEQNKTYTFYLKNIESVDGKIITSYKYSFKSVYIPFNKLSKAEQEAQIAQTDAELTKFEKENPIIGLTPHVGENYSIELTRRDPELPIIVIRVFVSNADSRTMGYTNAQQKYKNDALNYLKSKNIDTNKYTIQYPLDN